MEEKLIEEEVARRVDSIVKQRVEEELSKRQDEIEAEVSRRVEEAKQAMEKQMLAEFEKERQQRIEEQKLQEVKSFTPVFTIICVIVFAMCGLQMPSPDTAACHSGFA